MFNFHAVNTLEINGSSQIPDAPVLSMAAGEDINALTWNSPYFTNFFKVYWSNQPFTSIDESGVHSILDPATSGATPAIEVTYDHSIPAVFSLTVLYYRVSTYNANGEALSNQVDSYNFRLAIYEATYNKTLDELTLRFTPELLKQYQDSKLWRSFVQSLCSELAQSRFEIKEALKQLNLQKAVDVFLNAWNNITGISRMTIPVAGSTTNETILETDEEYRQRLLDSVFWDKISNLALKKTLLLNLQYDADVVDKGVAPTFFREIPELAVPKLITTTGNRILPTHPSAPGTVYYTHPGILPLLFIRPGLNSEAQYVWSCTATESSSGTLTFSNYDFDPLGTPTQPVSTVVQTIAIGSKLFYMYATALSQPPTSDYAGLTSIDVGPISMYLLGDSSNTTPGAPITFWPSGATGTLVSIIDGFLTYELTSGSPDVEQWDWATTPHATNPPGSYANWLIIEEPEIVTSESITVRPKLLSNIYSVQLGVGTLQDSQLNEIYDEISPLAALGNVLVEILQDIALDFEDWDTTLGNIPYGPIFFGAETQSGAKSTQSNWSISEEVIVDNQRTMHADPPDDGDTFYGNDEPDDIVILTRTS